MRLGIGTRIFLSLTAVSLVILSLNTAVTRWTFERGFVDYVAEQELETLTETATSLVALYETERDWRSLEDNPRRWNELLRQNSPASANRRPPPPGGPPGNPRDRGGRPPPPDPLELGRRISLLAADGSVVVGTRESNAGKKVPVIVEGQTVGFVSIAPRRELTNRLDQEFLRQQQRTILVVGIAALLVAALISAFLARHLTRPIHSLAEGARAIAGGRFDTRIADYRNDELGDLAREFNRLAETLDANRQSRRRWVSDIAHELRTPLAIFRGELDAIEDGVRNFDARTLASLQADAMRLSALVDELHELSMYDEGGHTFRLDTVDVAALTREVALSADQRLTASGLALTLDVPDAPVLVPADRSKLERVFTNLIENSLRYTDAPGQLLIRCSSVDDGVAIDFSDSSPGVAADELPKLFDRLYRVDASRNRSSGGSGLGLAICRAIVEGHMGMIEASKSKLGGVTIRVLLPLARDEGPSHA